jgi:hypothetical protein
MTAPKHRHLPQPRGQLLKLPVPLEPFDSPQLIVSGSARAHEIRMVSVGDAIRAGASRRDDRSLFEREHRASGTGQREHVGDRIDPLCVRSNVPTAVNHRERRALAARKVGDEARAVGRRRADFQVGCARARQRTRAQERAPNVGGATARTSDDTPRWMVERTERLRQDARFVEGL